MSDDERAWFRQSPEPQSSSTPDHLSLWNYPVAGTQLSPGHELAIRNFTALAFFANSPQTSLARFVVRGHASASGEEKSNVQLAQGRAENVAKYLTNAGIRSTQISVSNGGAAEPVDRAPAGPAFARNRRVDLTMYLPTMEDVAVRPVPTDLGGRPPSQPSESSATLLPAAQFTFSWKLPAFRTPNLVIEETLEVGGKVRLTGGKGGYDTGLIAANLKVGVKLEKKLFDDLAVKVGITPSTDKKLTTVSVGVADKLFSFPVELGLQTPSDLTKPTIVYFSISLPKFKTDFELAGSKYEVEFTVLKVKFAVGPSPALLARMARFAAPVAAPALAYASAGAWAASVGGPLIVFTLIVGGTVYFAADAQREGLEVAHRLAKRDGAASRAALEALGADARAAYEERRKEWLKIAGSAGQDEFLTGVRTVEELVKELSKPPGDAIKARRTAWVATYAKGANATDFTAVRERMFLRLGGYEKAETDLKHDVGNL